MPYVLTNLPHAFLSVCACCACVCVHMWLWVHVSVCAHVEARGQQPVSASIVLHLINFLRRVFFELPVLARRLATEPLICPAVSFLCPSSLSAMVAMLRWQIISLSFGILKWCGLWRIIIFRFVWFLIMCVCVSVSVCGCMGYRQLWSSDPSSSTRAGHALDHWTIFLAHVRNTLIPELLYIFIKEGCTFPN